MTQIIIVKIIKEHVGKSSYHLRNFCVVYEPVSQDPCSRCNIKSNIIMNMLLPSSFVLKPGSYFNKESELVLKVSQGTVPDRSTSESDKSQLPK